MAIRIDDPNGFLPKGFDIKAKKNLDGILQIRDIQVPIFSDSIFRILEEYPNQPVAYIPTIPTASDLGLMKYKPQFYWLPTKKKKASFTVKLHRLLTASKENCTEEYYDPAEAAIVTDTTEEEQLYYFAEQYNILCPKPIQVSVVVSNVCNLSCVMCPYHSKEIAKYHKTDFFNKKQIMSWEMMKYISAECGANNMPIKMGNIEEPLTHPRIADFVRECRQSGVPTVHITTNGTLLDEAMARQLLEAGLTSIYISIDAAEPDTYEKIRGSRLERVESNINGFIRIKKELGISCMIMLSIIRNKEIERSEIKRFIDKWISTVDGIIVYNLAIYDDGSSNFTEINNVAKEKVRSAGKRWACLNPFQEIYLLPDGRTFYCCETISKLAFENINGMGNYTDESIIEIWGGKQFIELRKALIMNKLEEWTACRDCGIWMAHVTESKVEGNTRITRNMITEIYQKV